MKKLLYNCNAVCAVESANMDTSFEDKKSFASGKRKWSYNHDSLLLLASLDTGEERIHYSM